MWILSEARGRAEEKLKDRKTLSKAGTHAGTQCPGKVLTVYIAIISQTSRCKNNCSDDFLLCQVGEVTGHDSGHINRARAEVSAI